jgi:chlorobactene glucosyltransferase
VVTAGDCWHLSGVAWLLPGLIALCLTILNGWRWARPRPSLAPLVGSWSVLIPARNEAAHIVECLTAVQDAISAGAAEILVYDDHSTDDTAALVDSMSHNDVRIRRIAGVELPSGWVGKAHACHQLLLASRGDTLLFVDADCRLSPGAAAALALAADDVGAGIVTVMPRQRTGSAFEELMMPLLHVAYTAWLYLPAVARVRSPAVLAANGQVVWATRQSLLKSGGFEAIRHEVVDDMALCRAAKRAGIVVQFVDGHHLATTRMYRSARELIDGFSKNLFEGVGGLGGIIMVMLLYGLAFIAPVVMLLSSLWPWGLLGVGMMMTMRMVQVWRYGHVAWSALLHPVAVLVFLFIAVRSTWWSMLGRVSWRGRVYRTRAKRQLDGDA